VALLPDTGTYGASIVAENIRQNIENLQIQFGDSGFANVTVSLGVNTAVPIKDSSIQEYINGADKALYAAKKAGRNRVAEYHNLDIKSEKGEKV